MICLRCKRNNLISLKLIRQFSTWETALLDIKQATPMKDLWTTPHDFSSKPRQIETSVDAWFCLRNHTLCTLRLIALIATKHIKLIWDHCLPICTPFFNGILSRDHEPYYLHPMVTREQICCLLWQSYVRGCDMICAMRESPHQAHQRQHLLLPHQLVLWRELEIKPIS
jgi:hypothetical protein